MHPKKGSRSLRKGRFSHQNNAYHITLVTLHRKPVFKHFLCARQCIKSLKMSDEKGVTQTLSFCIMPDHVHWLFILKSNNLSQVIARVKSHYTRALNTKIWQDGFHYHLIRSNEDLINVARYIVANPVRAKIIDRVANYPHWDAIWL